MSVASEEERRESSSRADAEELLEAVRELVEELHPKRKGRPVRLESSLERDLGLDSLGRAELLLRLEQRFGVDLPERVLAEAESPRDLLRAVAAAGPKPREERVETAAEEERAPAAEVEAEGAPASARTMLEVLEWHTERHSERRHLTFLAPEGSPEQLTYGELRERARRAAAALQGLGLEPGEKVALMLPSGLDYFAAFLGTQLAGGVPVPIYPPTRKSQLEDHLKRQAGILRNAQVRILVAFPEIRRLARLLKAQVPDLAEVVASQDLDADPDALRSPGVESGDTAFLQYTSGSTGAPKGVVLTHDNLLANLRAIGEVVEIGGDDKVVSWLPLYHDMGLIGAWMGSLYYGVPLVLMSPLSFLARPRRWLEAISRHRGTLSAAPNFAYELCLKKIGDEELEGLDLSGWRAALNGAEPVSPETVERFARRFAACGFRREAILPVYGLAENALAVAFPEPEREPRIDAVRRDAFQRTGRAEPAEKDERDALRFVSAGRALPGHEIRVVDEQGREVDEREQGRIQFRGPSATGGYYRNPEADEGLFHGDWLDTGDLGYLADGELFVTGRTKDLIIRAGRNIYPQELEEVVGRIDGVRKGCVAAFASRDPDTGNERLVVVAETRDESDEGRERIRAAIESEATELTGVAPDDVVLVGPGSVPKTSSGKIRRSACRELYEDGRLGAGRAAVWWQLVRLAGAGMGQQLGRVRRRLAAILWGSWAWAAFGALAAPVWLGLAVLPGRARRRRFARGATRTLAGLCGVSVRVSGRERLEGADPLVLASNHASYLDGFALTAALPPRAAFTAKAELQKNFLTRIPLERLGAVFVERFDPEQGTRDTARAAEALHEGDSLVVFPEGTFQRAAGLMPFRMGAFVAAAEAGAAVAPVAIRGTRAMLPAGRWLPRRGVVSVEVLEPTEPEGSGWSEAVRLRDRTRERLLARLGVPDLEA